MDEIRRARKLTEEILARAASIKTHMAQVNQSMANMALLEAEQRARAAGGPAQAEQHTATPPRRLMDLPNDILRLIAAWCGHPEGPPEYDSSTTTSTATPSPVTSSPAASSPCRPSPHPAAAPAAGGGAAGSGAASLAALAASCRRWRRVVAGEGGLWRSMCRRRWGVSTPDAASVLVLHPRHLHLAAGWPAAATTALTKGAAGGRGAGRSHNPIRTRRGDPTAPAPSGVSNGAAGGRGAAGVAGGRGVGGGTRVGGGVGGGGDGGTSGVRRVQPSPPRAAAVVRGAVAGGAGGADVRRLTTAPPSLPTLLVTTLDIPPTPTTTTTTTTTTKGPPLRSPPASVLPPIIPPPSPSPSPSPTPTPANLLPGTSSTPPPPPLLKPISPTTTDHTPSSSPSPSSQDAPTGLPTLPPATPSSTPAPAPPGTATPPASSPTTVRSPTSPSNPATTRPQPPAVQPTAVAPSSHVCAGGGDPLEPLLLGWVVGAGVGLGLAGGDGEGRGGGDGDGAGGSGGGSGGLNSWQLVYRDRLVGWRGVCAVFRRLQSAGCPSSLSGTTHRQQLLLALRHMHLILAGGAADGADADGGRGGGGGGVPYECRTAAAVLAGELLAAVPDLVPCLLALLHNDSGQVVGGAAAGLADLLALDQEATAEAVAGAAGGSGTARRNRRWDDPGLLHHVLLASNGGRTIAAQLRDGLRSPGVVRHITRCLVNLWSPAVVLERVPRVVPLQPHAGTAGGLGGLVGAGGGASWSGGLGALPVLESGVWQLQEFSARGDPLRLIHTFIIFRHSPTAVNSPSPTQPTNRTLPAAAFAATGTMAGGTGRGLGAAVRQRHRVSDGFGALHGAPHSAVRHSWAGESDLTAATGTSYGGGPLVGPDGRPVGGTAAALVALRGGTAAEWGGGRPVVELLGGGYDVMLPRGAMWGGPAQSPASDREAEEFRLSGWVDPATGEWAMQRMCVNVPFALSYKGYSDARGCWGTYTVVQDRGMGAGLAAAAGVTAAGAGGAAGAGAVGVAGAGPRTGATTVGGGSSARGLRVFRLFRDPSLPPPEDLLKLLETMREAVSEREGPQMGSRQQEQYGSGVSGVVRGTGVTSADEVGGRHGEREGTQEEAGEEDNEEGASEEEEDPELPHLEPLYGDGTAEKATTVTVPTTNAR